MPSFLSGKVLTVVGGSGYVGSNITKQAVALGAKVYSINRSGRPAIESPWTSQVNWVKGDAMNTKPYEDVLKESDAVIHTVGTLIDTSITKGRPSGEVGTYEHMNRETAKSIGNALNELKSNKKIVYISGEKAPPLIQRYITTKREAEDYLFKLENLRVTVLRPGFIYNRTERPWSLPLKYGLNFYSAVFGVVNSVVPKETIVAKALSCFDMAGTIDLDSVVISAIVAAFDPKFDGKILNNKDMETVKEFFYQNGLKI